ncbi:EAP30/Vps36 family-domain-containing protein [Pilobolus umbonatus]|nr:EAP30/Vps36 family-domain-containing protein [Pilobolus umbonatus]
MAYFQSASLSASKRPELAHGETILMQQAHIGLYEGKKKLPQYQDGVCYLTSHRIVYVDNIHPLEYSIEIGLNIIRDIESYNGFLRSSPKITLHLDTQNIPIIENESSWACSICFFMNKASEDKCQLCGVNKQTNESIPITSPDTEGSSTCGVCTFINHPSMIQCEICGADLRTEKIPKEPIQSEIRLSFRSGGHTQFLQKLKNVLHTRPWEKVAEPVANTSNSRGFGISAIEDRIEKTTLETNETMADAFQDLDKLMSKAVEMVKLAESISNKFSKDPTQSNSELSTLKTYLLNLGITSPVTKDTAGSIYHQELAKELSDFLGKIFKQDDEIKALTDIYCLFNRASGAALISPEDLYKASQQFEPLKLPFRVKRFPSGLLVIHSMNMDDNRIAHRIVNHVKDNGGHLSALLLSDLEHLPLTVASEQLLVTERMGLLCRDDGPTGLMFYENLFSQ